MYLNKGYESSLDRPYYISAGRIAATTSIQTPNQLYELQQRLNSGVKNVELSGPLDPGAFEQIPREHFDEMRRLAKLSGAEISLHAPMFDISGFDDRGGWSEENRKQVEEQFKSIVERANKLSDRGNIPITIHTNRGIPSMIPEKNLGYYSQEQEKEYGIKGLAGKEIPRTMYVIDQEEGRLLPIQYEQKDNLGGKKTYTPHERLENVNETQWQNQKLQIFALEKSNYENQRRAQELISRNAALEYGNRHGTLLPEEQEEYKHNQSEVAVVGQYIAEVERNMSSSLNELNHKLSKYGNDIDPEQRQNLDELNKAWEQQRKISEKYSKHIEEARRNGNFTAVKQLNEQAHNEIMQTVGDKASTENTLRVLSGIDHPRLYVPVDEFVSNKASQTIVNTALHAYKEFGENAPTIAVENWHPDTALSRGESFQQFITRSKNDFTNALVEKNGLDKNEAKKVADKLIGATWDVAHINLLRKYGYSSEDVVKEAEQLKGSDVKKVHLADNFGYSDAHLVTGMGNVPTFKEIQALEKTGMRDDVPMIGEFGAFDTMFKESSFPYILENVNSPLYSHKNSIKWGDARDNYPDYFGGYGMMLPDLHFREFYGGGFSSLPKELGGQMGGDRSRFSGTPNQ